MASSSSHREAEEQDERRGVERHDGRSEADRCGRVHRSAEESEDPHAHPGLRTPTLEGIPSAGKPVSCLRSKT
jgi:hypothetical protein